MPPPPPPLPAELLEEIFLRLPPNDPACLVRASLSSKLWLGLLSGPRFRGRYREHHGAPPVLGFFYSWDTYSSDLVEEIPDPLFISTKFPACIPHDDDEGWEYSGFDPWDCRHGRVVLGDRVASHTKIVVLDPMIGCWWEMRAPEDYLSNGAAVLCDSAGCDHRLCHEGPFRVVLVGMDLGNGDSVAYAHEYLQVTGESLIAEWSKPSSGLHLGFDALIQQMPPVLMQYALYFMFVYDGDNDRVGILKYDLCSKCLSVIDAPLAETYIAYSTILIGMEDGNLGFAHLDGLTINLWSRQMGSNGVQLWTKCRVIDLEEFLLPIQNLWNLSLLGSVEGRDIILVSTDLGIYEISLKSLEWKKIWKRDNFRALVPYMTFYDQ
ncbi:unnamed protein product [Alopecurus aequalis]